MKKLRKDETETPQVSVTPDNVHEHPDSTPEQLHSFVQDKLAKPTELEPPDHAALQNVTKHPNTPSPSLEAVYGHYFPKSAEGTTLGAEEIDYDTKETIGSILSHANTPASVVEDFLSRTYKTGDSSTSRHHQTAAQHPGVSSDLLQQLTDEAIQNPDTKEVPTFGNLHPDYYFGLLSKRPEPPADPYESPETRTLDNHIEKLDTVVTHGIANTTKHTPETLNRTVDFFTQDKPKNFKFGAEEMKDFINKQPDLTPEHLEKLSQAVPSNEDRRYYHEDALVAIIQHKNVDPGLIAKFALDTSGSDYYRDDVAEAATASPKLPLETKNQLVSQPELTRSQANGLFENPNLTPEDVTKLYQQYPKSAMLNPKASTELIEQYYKDNPKVDGVRAVLQRAELPTSILTNIVSKQKNQDEAVNALNHPSATMEVVNAGLKRRAVKVQEAAMRHPLVAKQLLVKRLTTGEMTPWEFVGDASVKKALDGLPQDAVEYIHKKYSADQLKENPSLQHDAAVWSTKNVLANEPGVDPVIQSANRKDMINYALDNSQVDQEAMEPIPNMVSKHVMALANKGDQDSQMAIAKRPYWIHNTDVTNDKLSPEFLRAAYETTEKYHDKIKRAGTWGGDQEKLSLIKHQMDMTKNVNLPQDLFDKITLQLHEKDGTPYLGHHSFYSHVSGGGYYGRHNTKEGHIETVFDKRYQGLPEEERRAGFMKLMAHPEGAKAVVRSTQAPKDMWTDAWKALSDKGRSTFLEQYELADFAPEEVQKEALAGHYNSKNFDTRSVTEFAPQEHILQKLDPKRTEHRKMLLDYLNNAPAVPLDWKLLNEDFFKGPEGRELAATALSRRTLGEGMPYVLAHAYYTYDKPKGVYNILPAMQDQIRTDRLNAVKSLIDEQTVKLPPGDESDYERNAMWMRFCDNKVIGGHGYSEVKFNMAKDTVGSTGNPNGKLDFLIDMTGEGADTLANTAAGAGLISHDTLLKAAQDRPYLLEHALSTLGHGSAAKTVQSFIQRPQLDDQTLTMIVRNLHSDSFTHKRDKSALSEAEMEEAKGYTDKLLAHVSTAKSPNRLIATMCKGLFTDGRSGYGALPMARRKELISHIVAKIPTLPVQDTQKAAMMSAMADALDQDGYEQLIPGSLQKTIVQTAIDNNDIQTLMNIVEEGKATPAITRQIAKIFNKPEVLNNSTLAQMGEVLESGKVPTKQAKKILGVIQERRDLLMSEAQIDLTGQPVISDGVLALNSSIYQGAKNSLIAINEDKDSPDYFIGIMQEAAQLGSPNRMSALKSIMDNIDVNKGLKLDTKIRMFQTMPEIAPDEMDEIFYGRNALHNPEVLNSPDVIKSAEGGWRLAVLANSACYLNKENLSTVINRVVSAQPNDPFITPNRRYNMGEDLVRTGNVKDEDLHKLLRSVPMQELLLMADQISSNYHSGSVHVLAPLCLDHLEQQLNSATPFPEFTAPATDSYEDWMQTSTMASINRISRSMVNWTPPEIGGIEIKDANYKNTSMGESRGRFIQLCKQTYQKLSAHVQTITDTDKGNDVIEASKMFKRTAEHLLTEGLHKGVQYDAGQSMDLLDMMNYGDDLMKAHYGFKSNENVLKGWIIRCNPNPDQWSEVFTKKPELVYTLNFKDEIDHHIIDAINFDSHFAQDSNFAQQVGYWLDQLKPSEAPELVGKLIDAVITNTKKFTSELEAGKNYLDSFSGFANSVVSNQGKHIDFNRMMQIEKLSSTFNKYDGLIGYAITNGAGGQEYFDSRSETALDEWIDSGVMGHERNLIFDMAASPMLSEKIAGKTIEHLIKLKEDQQSMAGGHGEVLIALAKNHRLSPYQVNTLVAHFLDTRGISKALMNNPGIDQENYFKIWEKTKGDFDNTFPRKKPFNPAFTNPKWGGALFRSLPLNVPKRIQNIDRDKLVKSAEYSQSKQRLNQVLSVMPPEGLTWQQLKQQYKQFTNWPEVKAMFPGGGNKPIMPEAIAKEMTKYDGYDFHITYSEYDDFLQRHQKHPDNPNLVVQLNTSEKMEQQISEDPRRWAFFQFIQKAANGVADGAIGFHPVTPHIASWVRVDTTGGKEGWIIEEAQSDFDASLRKNIDSLVKQAESNVFYADGNNFTTDELYQYANDIQEILSGWHRASLVAIEDLAKQQGVKNVYMHGLHPRAVLSFESGATNKLPGWIQKGYEQVPRDAGYQECDYTDYPTKSADFLKQIKDLKLSTKCWVKKLS